MGLLSAADVAELSAFDESTMTDTATIIRDVTVGDGAGGQTFAPATVNTVKCRLMVRRFYPHETDVSGQLQSSINMEIRMPTGTDVRNADRIVIGSRTFEVGKSLPHTWQTSLLVRVAEIT